MNEHITALGNALSEATTSAARAAEAAAVASEACAIRARSRIRPIRGKIQPSTESSSKPQGDVPAEP